MLVTVAYRYVFGDREYTALRMLPCQALTPDDAPESRQVRRARERADQKIADKMLKAKPREVVQSYIEHNYRVVFWSAVGDAKGPHEPGWPNKIYGLDEYKEGDRVGLLTGTKIASGFIHDVDLDWAPGSLIAQSLLPPTSMVFGRASKRVSHCLYTLPEPLPSVRYEDIDKTCLIELRGTKADGTIGLQSMAPPSVWSKHGQREPLEFVRFGEPAFLPDVTLLTRPVMLSAIGMLSAKHLGINGFGHEVRLAWAGFLLRAGVTAEELVTMGEAISVYCHNLETSDIRRAVESTATALASGTKKVKGGPALAKLLGTHGKKIIARVNEWLGKDSDFIRVDGVIVKDSQENLRRALATLEYELSFNTFSEKFMVNSKPLGDPELVEIWARIDEECRFKPEWQFFRRIINRFAWNNPYHPVRDYLDGLTWDGTPRIDHWLETYGGAVDRDRGDEKRTIPTYLEAVSAIVLIAGVRRIRQPGCKYDEMVILESPQGFNKSMGVRALCPNDEWFSDDFPLNLKAKELIEATLGKWIIEASELSGKRKAEIERLKASLSRQVDGPIRKAYGWMPEERPRHFILIGTTNATAYLNDPTGARRFWPVEVQRFNVEGLARDRDQLWAEAAHREARGASIRLPECLWPDAAREQEQRREIDPWEETLRRYLLNAEEAARRSSDLLTPHSDGKIRVQTVELWEALGVDTERRDRVGALRIADIMQRWRFKRGSVRKRGSEEDPQKGYIGDTEKLVLELDEPAEEALPSDDEVPF